MKKILLLVAAVLLMTTALSQSQNPPLAPPDTIMTHFTTAFPGIEKVKWNKSKKNIYMGLFKSNEGLKTIVYYAPNGRWLQTKRYLYELPPAIEDAVYKLYEYAELKKMVETEKATGKQYLVVLDSGKVLAQIILDENAQVIKKQEKPKEEQPDQ